MAVSTCLPLARCKHEPAHVGHTWVTASATSALGYCQGAGDADQLTHRACAVVTVHHGHVWAPPGLAELRWCPGDGQNRQQEPPDGRYPRLLCTAERFHPEHPWQGMHTAGWVQCPGLKAVPVSWARTGADGRTQLKFSDPAEAASFMRWWREHGALAWALQGAELRYSRITMELSPLTRPAAAHTPAGLAQRAADLAEDMGAGGYLTGEQARWLDRIAVALEPQRGRPQP